jgi:hypothetical protein
MKYSSVLVTLIVAHFLIPVLNVAAVAQPSETTEAPPVGSARWFLQVLPEEEPADGRSQQGQLYGQLLPSVGRDDLWSAYPNSVRNDGACGRLPQVSGSIQEQIIEFARSTQIVIINEAHDMPWHREMTLSLLEPLWDQGYRYLAAEAFSEQVHDYPEEAFGRLSAGYYTVDPVFGELIRAAKRLGYELVPYEAPIPPESVRDGPRSERIAFREEAQANQLMERVFARDAEAKVIVHVGYSHATEVPIPSLDGSTMSWMATRLKEKSDIDPLTIDQTYCRSPGADLELARPTDQMPFGTFDLAIAYPDVSVDRGRATWRLSAGKQLVDVPEESIPNDGRAILEVRHANESDRAIPVDRLLMHAGESIPLVLPEGRFRLTVLEEVTGEVKEFQVVVE